MHDRHAKNKKKLKANTEKSLSYSSTRLYNGGMERMSYQSNRTKIQTEVQI